MNSIFDEGRPTPCPAPFNLSAYVLARARDLPDKIALAVVGPSGAERWSYLGLEGAVLGTARGLLSLGLSAGDRILLRLGNTVDFPVAFLGAIAAGLVPVPTSAQLTAPEVERLLSIVAPRLVVRGPGVAVPETLPCPLLSSDDLRAMRDLSPVDWEMGEPDRPAYIVFTSGTGGNSRAVVHAHRAVWARRMMWRDWYGLRETDRLLHAGAFNWTYTLGTGLLDPWSAGATALIPAEGTAADMLGLLLKRHDATLFAAAPGVYRKMLRHGLPAMPKLRHGLSAGEKLPQSLRTAWEKATGTTIHEAYGMSECSTPISGSPGRPAPDGLLGWPQEGRRIAVVDAEGIPVTRGATGIIAISRDDPGLMLGYLGARDATEERFRGEWFLTGDAGVMRDDGAVAYLGRNDDMLNAGGLRVSPIEVESALNLHPGVHECAVAEVEVRPDVTVIAAFYVADEELTAEDLTGFLAERLAHYKTPRIFRRIDALPRGANNKILRRDLRRLRAETDDEA